MNPLSVNVFRVFRKTLVLPFLSLDYLDKLATLCYRSIASVSLNFLFYQNFSIYYVGEKKYLDRSIDTREKQRIKGKT